MIINTDKIREAIFEGTAEEVTKKYGLKTRTVGAYRRGERDITSMKLGTAMKIAQILIDEHMNNHNQALKLIRGAKFIFEADTWQLYQKEDENSFIKIVKDDSVPPKTYTLPQAKAEAVLIMLNGLRDLQLQGQDLSDSYEFLVTDYFN